MLEKLYEAMDQGYEITVVFEFDGFVSRQKMFVDELCPYDSTIEIWGSDNCVIIASNGWEFRSEEVEYYSYECNEFKCKIIF